jgi:uncharacterized protein YbaP (TraB family)
MRLSRSIIAVFLLLPSCWLYAADTMGPVWKVTKGEHSLFLGGTIHLLSEDDYPLPAGFDKAYQQADVLVFETDVSQMQTPEMQYLIIEKTLYKNGLTLKKTLNAKTYAALLKFLDARGGNINSLESFKPGMVTMMLTLNEISRLGQAGKGVDEFYNEKGLKDNKPLMFLETIEQQIDLLATMGEGQEDALLLYTLDELKNLSSALAALKSAWRQGDNAKLIEVALTPWLADFPALYHALLVRRNNAWLPSLEAMLTTPAVEYVLVGALHLVGEDGVLAMLASRGYTIEQLH